ISRPSASVLMTSIVFPRWLVTTSPGFTAVPLGMFSVLGISPTTCVFGLRRLDRDASRVEGHSLADQHYRWLLTSLVLHCDEPWLLGAALGHRHQGAHLLALDGGLVQDGDLEAVPLSLLPRHVGQ